MNLVKVYYVLINQNRIQKNDSITLGFCVAATVKDNNVINAKILYSYPLPLIESQWYNEKGE